MKRNPLVPITLLFSVTALFLEQLSGYLDTSLIPILVTVSDFAVLALLIGEIAIDLFRAKYPRVYLKQSIGSLSFAAVFVGLFVFNRIAAGTASDTDIGSLPAVILIIRNVFLVLRIFSRLRRLSSFLEEISTHPAQTILVSFLVVILAGSLLLMMPFTGAEGRGLGFVDAFFTATSAVCVTGLIVVDTATVFSIYGQIVILVLIQIGGLGIMLLSYFTVFVLRRSVSIEDKMLISYMLSEKDMTRLSRSLTTIVYTTLVIEAVGALVLAIGIYATTGVKEGELVLLSVFHSISAFCNAGFSLYSDSLERFASSPGVLLPVALLIIAGGISFSVITEVRVAIRDRIRRFVTRKRTRLGRLSPNSRAVLVGTGLLLVLGMLFFYALEFRNAVGDQPVGVQYLSAAFQSVTLRTAGFNSVPFGALVPTTYLVMALFMFIGGASGSTAGGIKVNTVAVMYSYLKAMIRNRDSVVIFQHSVSSKTVTRAFMILLFGIIAVSVGTILLSVFEEAPLEHLFFEVVSAFGTVGLSSGITAGLSIPGKLIVSVLMFMGRLGPLTILAAASSGGRAVRIEYPRGEIAIG